MKKILFLFLHLLVSSLSSQTNFTNCDEFLKTVPFFLKPDNKKNITNELLNKEFENLIKCGKLDSSDSEILNINFLFKNFYKNDKLIKPNITNQEILNKFFEYRQTEEYKAEYNKLKYTNYINNKIVLKQNRKSDSLVFLKIGQLPPDINLRFKYIEINNLSGMNYLEVDDELNRFVSDYFASRIPINYDTPQSQNLSETKKQSVIFSKNILFFVYDPEILNKDSIKNFFENENFKTTLTDNYIYYSLNLNVLKSIDDSEFQKFNLEKNQWLLNLNKSRGFYFLKCDDTFKKLKEYNLNFDFIEFKTFLDN